MALYKKKGNITDQTRCKMLQTRRINVLKRYAKIKELTNQYYEPENQNKCKIQAYRQHIYDLYPMSQRSFYQIMGTDVDKEMKELNKQMKLDF